MTATNDQRIEVIAKAAREAGYLTLVSGEHFRMFETPEKGAGITKDSGWVHGIEAIEAFWKEQQQ